MTYTQGMIAKQELEDAQKEMDRAWKRFDDANTDHRKELILVFEKISLYSAGIISLSITYLGALIVPEHKEILSDTLLKVPIYYALFVSWLLFTLSLISGLLIRWAESLYVFFGTQKILHEQRKFGQKKRFGLFQKYQNIQFVDGTNREEEKRICNKNIEILDGHLIPETEKKSNSYYRMNKFFQKLSSSSFTLGILLLLIFVIKTVMSLIYT